MSPRRVGRAGNQSQTELNGRRYAILSRYFISVWRFFRAPYVCRIFQVSAQAVCLSTLKDAVFISIDREGGAYYKIAQLSYPASVMTVHCGVGAFYRQFAEYGI